MCDDDERVIRVRLRSRTVVVHGIVNPGVAGSRPASGAERRRATGLVGPYGAERGCKPRGPVPFLVRFEDNPPNGCMAELAYAAA